MGFISGGILSGLGGAITQSGDNLARAKEAARLRAERERDFALRAAQVGQSMHMAEQDQALQIAGQLPEGTRLPDDMSTLYGGPAGQQIGEMFSRAASATPPDAGMPAAPPEMVKPELQAMPAQPAEKPGRYSVPPEDARYRSQILKNQADLYKTTYLEQGRNYRSDAQIAGRLKSTEMRVRAQQNIAQARMALSRQIANETNAARRQALGIAAQRLALASEALDAHIEDMNIDNLRLAEIAANPTSAGGDAITALLMAAMSGQSGDSNIVIPPSAPKTRPITPATPIIRGGPAEEAEEEPAPEGVGGAYQEYLRRRKAAEGKK